MTPPSAGPAEAISRAGDTPLSTVSVILDFSKIEAGHLDAKVTDVEVRTLIEQVGDLLGPAARAKRLRLAFSVAADVPKVVMGNPPLLRQVLLNLGSDAVKFTDEGDVTLRVGCRPGNTGRVLRFEVADTGIGIAPEHRHLLFQPFSQVDGSDTRSNGGTGLGLAISAG